SKGPYRLTLDAGEMRLAGILDEDKPVSGRQRHQTLQVGGIAVQVDRHDSAGFGRYRALDQVRIQVEGIALDVYEDRPGADQQGGVAGSGETEGRGDDLVSRADTVGEERQMQCRRSRGDSDRLPHLTELGEATLKSRHLLALGHLPGFEHSEDRLIFF